MQVSRLARGDGPGPFFSHVFPKHVHVQMQTPDSQECAGAFPTPLQALSVARLPFAPAEITALAAPASQSPAVCCCGHGLGRRRFPGGSPSVRYCLHVVQGFPHTVCMLCRAFHRALKEASLLQCQRSCWLSTAAPWGLGKADASGPPRPLQTPLFLAGSSFSRINAFQFVLPLW